MQMECLENLMKLFGGREIFAVEENVSPHVEAVIMPSRLSSPSLENSILLVHY